MISLVAMVVVALVSGLAGCAVKPHGDGSVQPRQDIHERLSAAISNDGFAHGIHSQRDATRDIDSIYVRVSLDTIKRRHYSLDNLMQDIGRICALPEFAHLPMRIDIGAGDAQDREYLKETLAPAIRGKANIEVSIEPDAYNDITITVVHPHK